MKKKVNVTVANRRKTSGLLSRIGDVFERKFDGFPASVPPVSNNAPIIGDDSGELTVGRLPIPDDLVIPDIPPCPDADGNCGFDSDTESFPVAFSGSWGSRWFSITSSGGAGLLLDPINVAVADGTGLLRSYSWDPQPNPGVNWMIAGGGVVNLGPFTNADHEILIKFYVNGNSYNNLLIFRIGLAGTLSGSGTNFYNTPNGLLLDGGDASVIQRNVEYTIRAKLDAGGQLTGSVWVSADGEGTAEPLGTQNLTLISSGTPRIIQFRWDQSSNTIHFNPTLLPTLFVREVISLQTTPFFPECQEMHTGTTVLAYLKREESPLRYVPHVPAAYYLNVWIGDSSAIEGLDYTVVDGEIYPIVDPGEDRVQARYVIS